jgi:hypothetical protein
MTSSSRNHRVVLVALLSALLGFVVGSQTTTTPRRPAAPIQRLIPGGVTYIKAGAADNYSRVPTDRIPPSTPGSGGTLRTHTLTGNNSSDISAIQSLLNSAQPNDIVQVSGTGTLTGSANTAMFTLARPGTAGNPIVFRATTPGAVTISGCGADNDGAAGCLDFTGSYMFATGFRFANTVNTGIITMDGLRNTLYSNTFDATGNGTGCSVMALVMVDGTRSATGGGRNVSAGMVRNTFNNPGGCVFRQFHGSVGNIYSHNIIQGANSVGSGGENYPFKIGESVNYGDTSGPIIQFNTIQNYGPSGYAAADIKISNTYMLYNLFDFTCSTCANGLFEFRHADDGVAIGNLFIGKDTWIATGGSGHYFRYNKVIASQARDNHGALTLFTSDCRSDNQFCPDFTKAATNTQFLDNAFVILQTGFRWTINEEDFWFNSATNGRPSGNTFEANFWLRKENNYDWYGCSESCGDASTRALAAGSWTNNRFLFPGGTASFSGIIGSGGNVAGGPLAAMFPDAASPTNPTEAEMLNPNQDMLCDPGYVSCPGGGGTTTTAATTTTTAATTTTTTAATTTTTAPGATTTTAATTTTTAAPTTTVPTTTTTVVAGSKSDSAETALLRLICSNTAWAGIAQPGTATAFDVALHTADPGEAGSSQSTSEVAYSGYARRSVSRSNGFTVTDDRCRFAARQVFASNPGAPFTVRFWSLGYNGVILYRARVSTGGTIIGTGSAPVLTTGSGIRED